MIRWLIVTLSLSLALAALLVMFTPFLRDFSSFHIGIEGLALGAFICGALCFIGITPTRRALIALAFAAAISSLIEWLVIALPALANLVPNPVSYINLAEQQVLLGCIGAGPFVLAGGVVGGIIRARMHRKT